MTKKKNRSTPSRVCMVCEIGGGYTICVLTGPAQYYFAAIVRKRTGDYTFSTELYARERTAEQQAWKLLASLRNLPPVLTVHRTHDGKPTSRTVYLTSGLPKLVYVGQR